MIKWTEVKKAVREYLKEKSQAEKALGRGGVVDFFKWVRIKSK
jgi:hypothetical protein